MSSISFIVDDFMKPNRYTNPENLRIRIANAGLHMYDKILNEGIELIDGFDEIGNILKDISDGNDTSDIYERIKMYGWIVQNHSDVSKTFVRAVIFLAGTTIIWAIEEFSVCINLMNGVKATSSEGAVCFISLIKNYE